MSKLIIEEPPLQVLPTLALAIGLNEAIVLQQLHYLLRDPQFGRRIEEKQWIFNTVEQWRCRYFPFWSERTIKTIFTNLKALDLIETCQPEGRISRRKYYRINTKVLASISDRAKFVPSMGQHLHDGNGQNSSLPITKTSSKTSKQREPLAATGRKETHAKGFFSVSKDRKPPSHDEFFDFIRSLPQELMESLWITRSAIYEDLSAAGWRMKTGEPIANWKRYLFASAERIYAMKPKWD